MITVQAIGRLGHDATVKDFNGKRYIAFDVACSRKQETEWVSCLKYASESSTLQNYLKKGTMVFVEGQLSAKTWTDRSGSAQVSINCLVDRLELLGSSQAQTEATGQTHIAPPQPMHQQTTQPYSSPVENSTQDVGDDLPF